MLKAVIFDMDGVIIDSEPLHYQTNIVVFNKLGIEISEKEYDSFVGLSSKNMWEIIKNNHNLSQTVEELMDLGNTAYYEYLNSLENIKPIRGSVELIKELENKNIKIALASSSSKMIIDTVINKFNLKYYFDVIVSGDDVINSKPEPDIFMETSKRLNINPMNIIVIEDSCNGVIASKNAEMKCIGYKNINSGKQDLSKADFITDDLMSLNLGFLCSLF